MSIKYKFITAVCLSVLVVLGCFLSVHDHTGNTHTYIIETHSYTHHDVFYSDSVISRNQSCITFINLFGREQTVCSDNLIVTQY